ncbi:MAG TPA: hypothetical protein VI998_02040 [Patescibacteria group bacterium]|nr:hypothetical protein [Patescibacteria group bacterium]
MDKTISYLESRVWYRALKVLYIIFFCLIFLYWLGLWATEGNFEYPLIFLIGLALIALLFFIVKKVFYYIVLGAPLVPLPASESMKRMIFASKSEQLAPENKPTKRFYGKYSLWFLVFAVVWRLIFEQIFLKGQIIQPHSLSTALSTFLAILLPLIGSMLDFAVLYFLILWIADLIRRRGGIERSENKKVKLVINIIFASIFLLMIIALILNSFKS